MPAIQYKFYSIQTVQRLHKLYYYYDYVVDVANYLLQQGCIEIYSAVRLVGRPFSRTKSPSRTRIHDQKSAFCRIFGQKVRLKGQNLIFS